MRDALGTGVFGDDIARSEAASAMVALLAELDAADHERALTPDEQAEQTRLRAILAGV